MPIRSENIEERLDPKCPFCRHPVPTSQMEGAMLFQEMDRVKLDDPVALRRAGLLCHNEGDHNYWTKATELGDLQAHYTLSVMYQQGLGIEKDKKKELHHLEQAAIGGHPAARFNLGFY